MAAVIDRAVVQLPFTTKTHALEEGRKDPRFWSYFSPLATSSNPAKAVDDDMKKAVINELDPTRYRETKGKWPVLRNKVRTTLAGINQHYTRTGTLDGLARFVFGLGQEDTTPQFVTDLSVPETSTQAPMPGLVTSMDMTTPSEGVPGLVTNLDTTTPSEGVPGLVTNLDTQPPSEGVPGAVTSLAPEATAEAPSAGASAAAGAARAAGAAAPAAARAATPAPKPAAPAARPTPPPPAAPSVWATTATPPAPAAREGAKIYSGVVAQDAQAQAQRTI